MTQITGNMTMSEIVIFQKCYACQTNSFTACSVLTQQSEANAWH
jgi:hypothetical protein